MIVLKKYIITFQYISLFDCILKEYYNDNRNYKRENWSIARNINVVTVRYNNRCFDC